MRCSGISDSHAPNLYLPELLLQSSLVHWPFGCSFFFFFLITNILFIWPHRKACKIFPDQEQNPCPLQWKWNLNPWTSREVPGCSFYTLQTSGSLHFLFPVLRIQYCLFIPSLPSCPYSTATLQERPSLIIPYKLTTHSQPQPTLSYCNFLHYTYHHLTSDIFTYSYLQSIFPIRMLALQEQGFCFVHCYISRPQNSA